VVALVHDDQGCRRMRRLRPQGKAREQPDQYTCSENELSHHGWKA
jgi:hypothetical protein